MSELLSSPPFGIERERADGSKRNTPIINRPVLHKRLHNHARRMFSQRAHTPPERQQDAERIVDERDPRREGGPEAAVPCTRVEEVISGGGDR